MIASTDRDELFVATVNTIADEVAATHAVAVDRDARFPEETLASLREAGALGALVPVELGGSGVGLAAVAEASERLARRCAASAMVFAMHQIQIATLERHLQGSPWFASFLREVATDSLLVASATSEIGTGGDVSRSVAAVEPGADGFLTFEKRAPTVSYGAHCDAFLTTLKSAGSAAGGDQVLVLHRRTDSELEQLGSWDTLGMRGTCSPGYVLRGRVRPEQILATKAGEVMSSSMLPVTHVLWSFVWLGIASDAFDRARSSVRAASRRDPSASRSQARRLVAVMVDLELLRAEVHAGLADLLEAWERQDDGAPHTAALALRFNRLKLAASKQAHRVCSDVLDVIGIEGYRNDSPYGVGRHLRDALSAPLMVANHRIVDDAAGLLLVTKEP